MTYASDSADEAGQYLKYDNKTMFYQDSMFFFFTPNESCP